MKSVTCLGSGNAFNADGRGHACFVAESSGGTRILIDAGATALCAIKRAGIDAGSLDAVLLTHYHGDHFLGLPFVLLSMNFEAERDRPLVVAGPPGVERVVRAAMDLAYPDVALRFDVEYRELEPRPTDVAGCAVEARPVTHRPESVGLRVTGPSGRMLAFSGDAALDDRLAALVEGADLAVVECGLLEQSEPSLSHVSLSELVAAPGLLGARRLLFTHLTDEIAGRIEAAGIGTAARDGMVVGL